MNPLERTDLLQNPSNTTFELITDEISLKELCEKIEKESIIAVDTESNSFHGYLPRICLLQIATSKGVFVIDPLALEEGALSYLKDSFEDPSIVKVMHGANNDVTMLRRDFGFSIQGLFDTFVAARFLGLEKLNLGALLYDFFGVEVNKSFQRFNWKKRPIPEDALLYGANDVRYLRELFEKLRGKLEKGLWAEAVWEDSECLAEKEVEEKPFSPEGFWKIKGAKDLTPRAQARLRELYIWRHNVCMQKDLAAFLVLENAVMVKIAEVAPRNARDLRAIRGVSQNQIRFNRNGILSAVSRGNGKPFPEHRIRHGKKNPHPIHEDLYNALREWRQKKSELEALDGDLIATKQHLEGLSRHLPKDVSSLSIIDGMTRWRMVRYGDEWLEIIRNYRIPS